MQLTVLGCQAPYPGPGGACSGYLLQQGGQSVLIDCGSGVLANLGRYLDPMRDELTAVILSHLHHDHISDLWLLRYAMAYAVEHGLRKPLPVYLPNEPDEIRRQLPYRGIDLRSIAPDETLSLLGATFTFFATKHPLPCLGIRVQSHGATLVYTGDTACFDDLPRHCWGADLLLAECSLRAADGELRVRGHMTSEDAGRLAAAAQAQRLVLTHLWPEHETELLRSQAAAHCPCPVEVAANHAHWHI